MSKQVQEAYIVAATRTPVGKAPRGMFRNTRPDDLLVHALKSVLAQAPGLDPAAIADVIVGCAMPEAEQGMNLGRVALIRAGFPDTVNEAIHEPMYDVLLLQAKALALKQPAGELVKYLDVPVFALGDLFYIQNLTAVIAAQSNP